MQIIILNSFVLKLNNFLFLIQDPICGSCLKTLKSCQICRENVSQYPLLEIKKNALFDII